MKANPAYIVRYIFTTILLLAFTSCYYSRKATKKLLQQASTKTYDVIIVPGVPFESGGWSRTMMGRIYWAKYLYDRGIAKNIIFSGGAVYTPYYEGIVMAEYAKALGVPATHVFAETKAEHSTQNVYFSYQLAQQKGFTTAGLASDPFQTRNLRGFARRKLSRDIAMLPFVTDTLKVIEPTMQQPKIDSMKAFAPNFVSIKEREGFFKRLKGTLGLGMKSLKK